MHTISEVGFKLLMWLARVMVDGTLNDTQREELKNISIAASCARREARH
jgi:hypothetical protein